MSTTTNDDDKSNWTPIQIEGPLPMSVAGALMQMIGTAWPESVVQTSQRHALHMLIPPRQTPEDLDAEFLKQLAQPADDVSDDSNFLGFRDGWVAFAPPEELCLFLGSVAHSIFTAHEDAVNHVEWEVKTGNEWDDPHYVLSISTRKDRTPLAMRKAAEAEVERLKTLLERHGIDPQEKP